MIGVAWNCLMLLKRSKHMLYGNYSMYINSFTLANSPQNSQRCYEELPQRYKDFLLENFMCRNINFSGMGLHGAKGWGQIRT